MKINNIFNWSTSSLAIAALLLVPTKAIAQVHTNHPVDIEADDDLDRWAIAMSGGGLRSSLFMIGALKALEDEKLVSQASAISSVSGGSYASYWLYSRYAHQNSGDAEFGHYSLSDGYFEKRSCEILSKGNFVTIGQMAWNFVLKNAVGLYHRALIRTYGSGDSFSDSITLSQFSEDVSEKHIPMPVMNATINSPSMTGNSAILSFSPHGISNPEFGEVAWKDYSIPELPTYRIVAISGAAQAVLKQWIPNPYVGVQQTSLRVWDGGKSENLGAFSLITAGHPKVLIIDAEHDPDYGFGAFDILKERLEIEGIELNIPAIDEAKGKRQATSYYRGEAVRSDGEAEIVYIKMSLPKSLDESLAVELSADGKGRGIQQEFLESIQKTRTPSGLWNCEALDFQPGSIDSWLAFNTASYAEYLNSVDGTASVFNSLGINFLKLDFPQYSTIDQSFYIDQSLAFIGLGYLQAKDWLGSDDVAESSR